MNEQEKKVSSVEALFKDFSYSTLLSFISFVLWINFHCSFYIINLHHLILVLFCFTSPKKKQKRVWYLLLYTIYFRCNHPLITLVLLCSGSLKKKICKEWDFPVLNFRCSLLCYYPVVLVLLCSTSPKKKKKKFRIFRLLVLSPLLSFTTIATITDLQSQRSRRELPKKVVLPFSFVAFILSLLVLLRLCCPLFLNLIFFYCSLFLWFTLFCL